MTQTIVRSKNGLARAAGGGSGGGGIGARAALWSALAACVLGGCTLLLQEDKAQCSSSGDCSALGGAFVGSLCVEQRCVPQGVIPGGAGSAGSAGAGGSGTGIACAKTSDCQGSLGQDALCRQQECVRLTSDTCTKVIGKVSDDPGLIVGMLAPQGDQNVAYFANSLVTAVEVASKTYEQSRPSAALAGPAVVVCDESRGPGVAVKHLLDNLGATLILGPVLDENLSAVLNETRSKGVVVVSPTIDDPDFVTQANDAGLVWSCRRNRERVVNYYPGAIEHAVAVFSARRAATFTPGVKAALLAPSDPATRNFLRDVVPALTFGGAPAVANGNYAQVDYAWSASAATDYATLANQIIGTLGGPNLIIIPTSIDNVALIIDKLEAAWPASLDRPSYLIDEHADGLVSLVESNNVATGLRSRLLGLRPQRDADTLRAYQAYVASFKTTFGEGTVPVPRSEYAYDCFYEVVYAMALARSPQTGQVDLSGQSFRGSLVALSSDPMSAQQILVGPSNVATFLGSLTVRRDFNLVGSSGALSYFNPAKGYPDANGELYCVDRVTKDFCGTGVTFSPEAGGAKTEVASSCQCE